MVPGLTRRHSPHTHAIFHGGRGLARQVALGVPHKQAHVCVLGSDGGRKRGSPETLFPHEELQIYQEDADTFILMANINGNNLKELVDEFQPFAITNFNMVVGVHNNTPGQTLAAIVSDFVSVALFRKRQA